VPDLGLGVVQVPIVRVIDMFLLERPHKALRDMLPRIWASEMLEFLRL
jgi:hypothetical protein